MSKQVISIVDDFDECPSGREWIKSDPKDASGERFREGILKPALEKYGEIIVDLNGADSLPPSFLDEAFGRLVEQIGRTEFEKHLEIRLSDDATALRKLKESIELRSK